VGKGGDYEKRIKKSNKRGGAVCRCVGGKIRGDYDGLSAVHPSRDSRPEKGRQAGPNSGLYQEDPALHTLGHN